VPACKQVPALRGVHASERARLLFIRYVHLKILAINGPEKLGVRASQKSGVNMIWIWLLSWLMYWAMLIDALAGILSLGYIHAGLSLRVARRYSMARHVREWKQVRRGDNDR
jgi:hypothetical protein